MSIKWEGLDKLQKRLKESGDDAVRDLARGLKVEGELIMTASKRVTPVAPDGGTLRASGHVREPHIRGTRAEVVLGFGGGASEYALAVHEHPSRHSPPSWKGKVINWNAAGTGPKYLEKPVNDAAKGFGRRVAKHLDLF